ncbi:MAG: hypothetical protein KGJ09_04945 [Candidatus Omnitrophica bacterium]|nr:hypothetical protein [Candidatus Omnitrophota bacterium]MDE2009410.1 hypothetical protein [Candidatus Omnitrophota bacterium]MDE2214194.1 hypothetical protein [Candidatus Omnitrophota bacterium]MDE2231231.1 hypothetical protein [Candidatus Omnitrophota bacterium]
MASSKRIGLFLGEDKLTLLQFEKNSPTRVISSPLGLKSDKASPFTTDLTGEVQSVAILKKMLQDNRIANDYFYVSLPLKEIILRSFIIPYVKPDDLPNAVKFEAKKYLPFDIQELSYVFHTIPVNEGMQRQLQVIFFAARKDVLVRYERISVQVNMTVAYGEPYIVSLTKALLFRKEIRATDHLAFLALDRNFGRICFINGGIPQFIREFPVGTPAQTEETGGGLEEDLNARIVKEVGNSFEFYARQFNAEGIQQILVLTEFVSKGLLEALESDLKLKASNFSPVINTDAFGQSNDIDAIYAMGACVTPSVEALSRFNFFHDKNIKQGAASSDFLRILTTYKEIILTSLLCAGLLVVLYASFQLHLKLIRDQYSRLTSTEGNFLNQTQDSIEAQAQQTMDKLNQYKNVRTKSDVSGIILRLAAYLPQGTLLTQLNIDNNQGDSNDAHVVIDIQGMVVSGGPDRQIETVNRMFLGFKKDKWLAKYISHVNLVSLTHQTYNNKEVTGFSIHFS